MHNCGRYQYPFAASQNRNLVYLVANSQSLNSILLYATPQSILFDWCPNAVKLLNTAGKQQIAARR